MEMLSQGHRVDSQASAGFQGRDSGIQNGIFFCKNHGENEVSETDPKNAPQNGPGKGN